MKDQLLTLTPVFPSKKEPYLKHDKNRKQETELHHSVY